jgi:hypothetical protein
MNHELLLVDWMLTLSMLHLDNKLHQLFLHGYMIDREGVVEILLPVPALHD